jgi:hypothetical protein
MEEKIMKKIEDINARVEQQATKNRRTFLKRKMVHIVTNNTKGRLFALASAGHTLPSGRVSGKLAS